MTKSGETPAPRVTAAEVTSPKLMIDGCHVREREAKKWWLCWFRLAVITRDWECTHEVSVKRGVECRVKDARGREMRTKVRRWREISGHNEMAFLR